MATKKQKRAIAEAKREAFIQAERERGLRILKSVRENRERERLKEWEKKHERHNKFDDDCPHCSAIKKDLAAKSRREAISKVVESSKVEVS